MKIAFVFTLLISFQFNAFSQCSLGDSIGEYNASYFPLDTQIEINDTISGGEYLTLTNIEAEMTYIIDACGDASNTSITLYDTSGTSIGYSSAGCVNDGEITFVAPYSGVYFVQFNVGIICGTDALDHSINLTKSYSYCSLGTTNGSFDASTLTAGTRTLIPSTVRAGRFLTINNINENVTYTIDNCLDAANTSLTLYDTSNTAIAYSSFGCGNDGLITFTASASGTYKIQLNINSCASDIIGHKVYIEESDCENPENPDISIVQPVTCFGDTVILNFSGALNDAQYILAYEDSLNGEFMDTIWSNEYTFTPSKGNNLYYFKTGGGCVFFEGSQWDTISLNTIYNSPSFTYSANQFCANASNTSPTISGLSGGTFSVSNSGLNLDLSDGEIDFVASTVGSYAVTYETPGICPFYESFNIAVQPMENAAFNYVVDTLCQTGVDVNPTMLGQTGGTFSSTPAGMTIGTAGVISLASSTSGTYSVTYTTPGVCFSDSTISVTIEDMKNSNFSYPMTSYCLNATDPTPTITGDSGGGFSSTSGLSLDSNNGTIDLSASTAGNYTVTYINSGVCATSQNRNVVINSLDNVNFNYAKTAFCVGESDQLPSVVNSGAFSFSPSGLSINSTSGMIDISASTVGSYNLTYTTSGVCPSSITKAVSINELDVATISYSENSYCLFSTNPTPTISGATGGTFSSSPLVLGINSSTGEIDLASSPAAPYSVIYTTNGACPVQTVFPVTLRYVDNADFNYSKNNFCVTSSDPTPVVTGVGGGVFSSSSGNLALNTSNGFIDISASLVGNYSVTYTTGGTCPNSAVRNIIISTLDDASFDYVSPSYCAFSTNAIPSITGLTSGSFSSSPIGLSLLSNNGYINTGASDPGTYTVTYTTSGDCQNFSTDVVTIIPVEDASFIYDAVEYCEGDTDPSPTIVGENGGNFTSSPVGMSINSSTGVVDLSASSPEVYSVYYTTGGTCSNSSSQSIIVLESSDAGFNYSQSNYCISGSDPAPTITGMSSGLFTSSPSGLVMNQYSGIIDLSGSTLGTYTVTYSVQGDCPSFSTQTVTIDNLEDASFNYSGNNFCTAGADPSPVVTGVTGGTFSSSPAGLIMNASNGIVDVSASSIGVYSITYTTSGACANSSSRAFVLGDFDDASFNYAASIYCVTANDPMPAITGLSGGSFSSSPAGLVINALSGKIDVSASTPNVYAVVYSTAGDCPNSSSQSITISAIDDASFNYASAAFCTGGSDPTPTITGLSGGTFSSLPSGLNLNVNTGEISLSVSNDATYTVVYTTAGSCPNSSSQTVTINDMDNPNFNYGQPSFCTSSANPFPSILGDFGGVFSSTPAGLSINPTSGEVNIGASSLNNYMITYTTSGSCPSSSDVSLIINSFDDASFNYDAGSYCVSNPNPTPVVTGISGGTFSFSPSGLSFNSVDGTINLSNSLFGTYTVTYTTGGICGNSTSQVVTVTDIDDAGFTYGASHFCTNDADAIANITGLPGGVFSTSSTDLIVNATTGLVDVDVSVPGDYIVTYTTSSSCPTPNAKLFKLANVPVVNQVVNGCDSVSLNGKKYFTSQIVKDTLSGVYCDSVVNTDLVMNFANTGVDVVSAWCSHTWIDGNEYFVNNSDAVFVTTNQAGCDSLVTLNLTISSVDNSVTLNNSTFISGAANASYQWVNCTQGYSEIPNANSKTFTPIQNGNYAVIVTENACSDTSACIFLTNVGVEDLLNGLNVKLFPNPFNEVVNVEMEKTSDVDITITNIAGELISKEYYQIVENVQLDLSELESGVYFFAITTKHRQEIIKLIKQ